MLVMFLKDKENSGEHVTMEIDEREAGEIAGR